jgi:hypothetical protein
MKDFFQIASETFIILLSGLCCWIKINCCTIQLKSASHCHHTPCSTCCVITSARVSSPHRGHNNAVTRNLFPAAYPPKHHLRPCPIETTNRAKRAKKSPRSVCARPPPADERDGHGLNFLVGFAFGSALKRDKIEDVVYARAHCCSQHRSGNGIESV